MTMTQKDIRQFSKDAGELGVHLILMLKSNCPPPTPAEREEYEALLAVCAGSLRLARMLSDPSGQYQKSIYNRTMPGRGRRGW